MTDKAYIVANKQQELDVLKKFEEKGIVWWVEENANDFVPSENDFFDKYSSFPYAIIEKEFIVWSSIEQLEDETIVYDGRKEDEEVDTKYKVTQEFMNKLIEWRDVKEINASFDDDITYIIGSDVDDVPALVKDWWIKSPFTPVENNERLIAIIQWLNGEDVFEVEAPHKFVVRNDTPDYDGDYYYVQIFDGVTDRAFSLDRATRFGTREEAQEWANSHQVVVEIDEEGNEVE